MPSAAPVAASTAPRASPSLGDLPAELVLAVSSFLDAEPLRVLAQACARLRRILLRPTLLSFSPRLPLPSADVHVQASAAAGKHTVVFAQDPTRTSLLAMCYDDAVETPSVGGTSITYRGLRKRGDRCVFSRAPLATQLSLALPGCIGASHAASSAAGGAGGMAAAPPCALAVPIAPGDERFRCAYFEVTVVDEPHLHADLPMRIGLVLPDELADHDHPPGSFHGSIAYRSSDGYVDVGERNGELFQFGPVWRRGDTVGCGVAPNAGEHGVVFFTLNGRWIGDAPLRVTETPLSYRKQWHAAVSSAGPAVMAVNYGQRPFAFAMLAGSISPVLQARLREAPTPHVAAALAMAPVAAWFMEPNTLPDGHDTGARPTVASPSGDGDGIDNNNANGAALAIQFGDNGPAVARSCLSSLPIGHRPNYTHADGTRFQYFEATLDAAGPGFNAFVSIGIATRPYTLLHHIGWSTHSAALHSDDAKMFNNALQHGNDIGCEPFGAGAVVGCAYAPATGQVFFTRNGAMVGAPVAVERRCYHGAVAAIRAWRVSLNFGHRPFAFGPANAGRPE
ncbi:SPRY domain-containing protein 3 [Polyrhizophydium stewartii]|uniref:SPRY domain-containing protein 3 n=1 Tax=Polyrhizophydium stewartii TaxID=2732419 RepID=A0ABR4MZ59_9FUNG|nr:Rsp5p-dependent ubiquitination, sorting of cargo proteins at the multivesicular body [Polyrhizophydium stewartii]